MNSKLATLKETHPALALENRFFVLGVCVLVFTLLLIAYVVFGPPLCSTQKATYINVLLALSGGFFAWTFSGTFGVKARGIVPGAAIVAAGGFAVFLLLTQVLKIGAEGDSSCRKTAQNPEHVAHARLAELAVSTANINTEFIQLKATSGDSVSIHKKVQAQLTQAREMSQQHLSALQRGALSLYQAHLAAIASMTVENSTAATKDGRVFARQAAESANQALKKFTEAKHGGSDDAELAKRYLANQRSEEKAHYFIGVSKILDTQFAALDGSLPNHKEDDIFAAFEPISVSFLREAYSATDGPVKWFCQSKPQGRAPCV